VSSQKQIDANRRNGGLSPGPQTDAGKAVSSKNSLKHGLFSHQTLLPTEDPEEFAEFSERLTESQQPVGAFEELLVHKVVDIAWRLQRVGKLEAGILEWGYHAVKTDRSERKAAKNTRPRLYMSVLDEPEIVDPDRHEQDLAEQEKHKSAQESDALTYGEAFIRDSGKQNAFTKLWRYETSLVRTLLRLRHELERLQAKRQGKEVPVPLAADIDVSGIETE